MHSVTFLSSYSLNMIGVNVQQQERFRGAIYGFEAMVAASTKMIKAASILEIPVFATEQNPKISLSSFTSLLLKLLTLLSPSLPLSCGPPLLGLFSHLVPRALSL